RRFGLGPLGQTDQRDTGLGDRRFFRSDFGETRAEEMLVVEPDARDSADQRAFDYVGRVEPAAEPHFEKASVGWRSGEREKGDDGRNFEKAGLYPSAYVQHLRQHVGEAFVVDQSPRDPDAFVEADEVRAGESMDLMARSLERGAQKGDCRAFAVGACHVK